MARLFSTDAEILAELKKPFSLAYSAAHLGVALERLRSVRDANKTEIVEARIKEYKQSVSQIAFQLDLLDKLDSLKTWFIKQYGEKT